MTQGPIWELPDEDDTIEGLDEYGEPDPAYAAALGLVPAPPARRAGAAAIDIAVHLVLQVPFVGFALPLLLKLVTGAISWYGFLNHPDLVLAVVMGSVTVVLSVALVVVQLVLLGRSGVTAGKAITGLRAVNVKTLTQPGFWRVTLRAVVVWSSAIVVVGPALFFLSPLFDPQRRGRGWHDFIGQIWLVDVRRGLQPYDKKRMRIARKTVTAAPAPRAKALPSLATPTDAREAAEYRPAGRTSAGVLGAARPHGAEGRAVVGLTGLEETAEPGPAQPESSGPLVGGYLASQHRPEALPQRFAIRLDTGESVEVREPLVLGRMPATVDGTRTMSLADDTLSVSKTHLLLRPAESGLEVIDQGSTNGTAVVHDGVERVLTPGDAVVAGPGDIIRFGDRSARVADV